MLKREACLAVMVGLVGLSTHADPPPQPTEAAVQNQLGLDAHRRGDFARASELFAKAVELDPERGLYPYNLACALAQIRRQGRPCDAMFGQIMELLIRAAELDPTRKKRALTDPDLREFRHTVTFAIWAGANPETEEGIRSLLPKVHWDSTQVYASQTLGGATVFLPDGTVQMTPPDRGAWSVKGNRVTLVLDYAKPKMHRTVEYEFDGNTLRPKTAGELPLSDSPDECNL